MAILNFIKPDKVFMINSTENEGKFEFRPLEPCYGLTVGNALRRVLLSSLEGFAISSVKIEVVDHEFSSIEGVIEDVVGIILNLKQIRFNKQVEDADSEQVQISIQNQDVIKAGDFGEILLFRTEIHSSSTTSKSKEVDSICLRMNSFFDLIFSVLKSN